MDLPRGTRPSEGSPPPKGGRRRGLGRGIAALIGEGRGLSAPAGGDRRAAISDIRRNPRQPRRTFDPVKLAELAGSIRQNGVLQPLVVREVEGGYELIIGERRLRAAELAGLDAVPVVVREAGDAQRLELALIENVQREDLTPIEEALAYRQLVEEFGLTQEEVALRVGKSRAQVTNLLRILGLPDEVKAEIDKGSLSVGHGRAVLTLSGRESQEALCREVIRRGLSVRETEALVRRTEASLRGPPPAGARPRSASLAGGDVHRRAIEEELARSLGTRVRLLPQKRGGKLEIEYYSDDQLEGLLSRLCRREERPC